MKVWYDWEFLEDGSTIAPISVGMVAEDGRELYLVNEEVDDDPLKERIRRHRWLMANVVPHLPLRDKMTTTGVLAEGGHWGYYNLDLADNRVVSRRFMRNAIRDFLEASAPVQLWGYYSAYDHVALAQQFGAMINRPSAMPMWTNDIQQIAAALGLDNSLPAQHGTVHNALEDARWTRTAWEHLTRGRASEDET